MAWDVLRRARSDIGFNKFNLVFPDRGWTDSYIEAWFEEDGGGVGSLAPVGRRPVGTDLLERSTGRTKCLAFSEDG
jgi:hypothetical protein